MLLYWNQETLKWFFEPLYHNHNPATNHLAPLLLRNHPIPSLYLWLVASSLDIQIPRWSTYSPIKNNSIVFHFLSPLFVWAFSVTTFLVTDSDILFYHSLYTFPKVTDMSPFRHSTCVSTRWGVHLGIDPKSLHTTVLMQTVYNAVVHHRGGFLKHVAISVIEKVKIMVA